MPVRINGPYNTGCLSGPQTASHDSMRGFEIGLVEARPKMKMGLISGDHPGELSEAGPPYTHCIILWKIKEVEEIKKLRISCTICSAILQQTENQNELKSTKIY